MVLVATEVVNRGERLPLETEVTVPLVAPGGTAKVPSARKKFVVPPPLAGTAPERLELKVLTKVVSWVAVRAIGAAVIPLTLPTTVLFA